MSGWSAADLAIVGLSLKVAVAATLAALPFAVLVALALARGRFWGRSLLDACVHLHRSCELGYWLRRDAVGRGLMTEAANGLIHFGFARVGLHRIRCAAATDNLPSLRVIQRLGFHFEGIARQAELVGSRWLDHALFARLATDER
jgi:RimJ/RimL family protein N-acetyltransferase